MTVPGVVAAAPARRASAPDHVVRALVRAAAAGDRRAWEELVDMYSGLVWAVARQFRLGDADAADVTQTTWLRLLEHVDRLNDPARVGPWLATTARRECLRTVGQHKRLVPTSDPYDIDRMDPSVAELDEALLAAERQASVNHALSQLPPRWRQIMILLSSDPPTSYDEISVILGVPIGSIGPTRRRCLHRLETLLAS